METVVIIAQANKFGAQVTQKVAKTLNKFYLKINDLIQYSIAKLPNILTKADYDYLLENERKVLSEALSYRDTVYYCEYDLYVNNLKFFKNCSIIYLALSKQQLKKLNEDDLLITSIAFEDRDKILKQNPFVEITNLNLTVCANKIIEKLGEIK